MQIIQFLVGTSYASIHSFLTYTVPVKVSNTTVKGAASAASSVITSAAAAATSAGVGDFVKKMLLRAAGEPALADNVNGRPAPAVQSSFGSQNAQTAQNSHQGLYHTEYASVPCIDTSGQTFAVWLNVFYLTPLTFLFMRFFVKSYLRRASAKGVDYSAAAEKAGADALKGVGRELYPNAKKGRKGALRETPNGSPSGKSRS